MTTDDLVQRARTMLRAQAVREFDEPIELASGQLSRFFVDGKAGLARAGDLRLACEAIAAQVDVAGIQWDAAGGLTLGADHLSVGLAMVADRSWFFVRKEPKGRGTGKQIEGAAVGPGLSVLLVEDVTSTGGSMFRALDIVLATGATVVAAVTLLDRGTSASPELERRGIPFLPLATFEDFGMEPIVAP